MPDTVPEGGAVPPPLDSAWAESTRKKALLKLEKLDTDLKNYKGNSIKESIRYDITGHGDYPHQCFSENPKNQSLHFSRMLCLSNEHSVKNDKK